MLQILNQTRCFVYALFGDRWSLVLHCRFANYIRLNGVWAYTVYEQHIVRSLSYSLTY